MPTLQELEDRLTKIRQKLKSWEAAFAADNAGSKPSRDDVKRNPDIAQRYKDYNKIREKLSGRPSRSIKSPSAHSRKRPASDPVSSVQTPTKRQKILDSTHPSVIDPYDPPIAYLLSPSQQKSCLGPTPQKDGQILGMFDGLSSRRGEATPAKRDALGAIQANVQMTPSKHQSPLRSALKKDGLRRTQSLGNLDVKATPSTQRIIASCSPGSGSLPRKLRFDDTPSFLRRDSQQAGRRGTEEASCDEPPSFSPFAARIRRQNSQRSLSAIMQRMRDDEEDRLDEELDLLNEMEDRGSENGQPKARPVPKILVQDSQAGEMALGSGWQHEGHEAFMSEEDVAGSDSGQPARKWKKRGQKRTTRHVKMRPNTAKWQPEAAWKGDRDDDEGLQNEGTENDAAKLNGSGLKGKTGSKDQEKTSSLSKAKRKISATAHANFRALKIRNKNSKFKKGGGRRYR